jgi:hypothetical protein
VEANVTEGKPIRHRYPIWLSWPLEIAAFVIVVATTWNLVQTGLRVLLQQWPEALDAIDIVPYARAIVLVLAGSVPKGPVPWEELYPSLLRLCAWAAVLFFVAALLRNFLPALRLQPEGLQVRRGLGWATIPWDRITKVNSMSLTGERLVLLIQGKHWGLGPWFRFYSLLWGAGLKKGVLVVWHLSDFETFAGELVRRLQEEYGDEEMGLVVDDTAYSLLYALLFLPRMTWSTLFAPKQVTAANAFAHPKWIRMVIRLVIALLLILGLWRYVGVWWRFLSGSMPELQKLVEWPVLGDVLKLFGLPNMAIFQREQPLLHWPGVGLLLGQVCIILLLVAVTFLQGLFPDWILGAEGPSAAFRKRWLPVNWAAIRSIRETVPRPGRGIILVQVKWPGLTFWHALYSLFYGAGLRRGILFSSLLPGFEDLRQRIHLGVVRAHEKDSKPPEKPILVEHGEADSLLMLLTPTATMRQWAGRPEPVAEEQPGEGGGGLLKRPALSSSASSDMPWEGRTNWPLLELERPVEGETKGLDRSAVIKAVRAALGLALFPLLLILLEELLYPPLTRSLAFFSLSPRLAGGLVPLVLVSVVMIVMLLGEAPFIALLTSLIAEMYEQEGGFLRTLLLYPRVQSMRVVLGVGLLILGTTGMVQPLFLLWGIGSLVWGGIVLALLGPAMYGWKGWGNLIVPVGFVLYQALTLLVYFLIR